MGLLQRCERNSGSSEDFPEIHPHIHTQKNTYRKKPCPMNIERV